MAMQQPQIHPEYDAAGAALRVKNKRKAKIVALPVPATPVGPPTHKLNTDALADALHYVRCAVAKDDVRPTLASVYLADGHAVAADGFMLARYDLNVGPIKAMIPRDALAQFALYHDREITLTQEKPDLLAVEGLPAANASEYATKYIRLVEGNFPNSTQILAINSRFTLTAAARPLAAIARAATAFVELSAVNYRSWAKLGHRAWQKTEVENGILKLTIAMNGEMTLSRRDGSDPITLKVAIDPPVPVVYEPFPKKMGVRERAKIEKERAALAAEAEAAFYAQPPLVLAVNCLYLANLLDPLPHGADVRLGFTQPDSVIGVSSPQVPGWRAALMPMYLAPPPPKPEPTPPTTDGITNYLSWKAAAEANGKRAIGKTS